MLHTILKKSILRLYFKKNKPKFCPSSKLSGHHLQLTKKILFVAYRLHHSEIQRGLRAFIKDSNCGSLTVLRLKLLIS